jgi:hypothetical protein
VLWFFSFFQPVQEFLAKARGEFAYLDTLLAPGSHVIIMGQCFSRTHTLIDSSKSARGVGCILLCTVGWRRGFRSFFLVVCSSSPFLWRLCGCCFCAGLVDGRVLYDTLHKAMHPVGTTYPAFYDYLNCFDTSPCSSVPFPPATVGGHPGGHSSDQRGHGNASSFCHFGHASAMMWPLHFPMLAFCQLRRLCSHSAVR